MSMLPKVRTVYIQYGFLLTGILLVNVGLINWYLLTKKTPQVIVDTRPESQNENLEINSCDTDCINEIVEAKIKALPSPTVQVTEKEVNKKDLSVPTSTTNSRQPTPTPVSRVEYVGLSEGSASMTADWINLTSGKWLDTSLYGQLVSANWQGWVEIPGGSGTVWIRLYDATNARAVDGSEVSVTDTVRTSFYSGNISLWRGQNQYFIQVKSTGGGMVTVDGAKIKLVVR